VILLILAFDFTQHSYQFFLWSVLSLTEGLKHSQSIETLWYWVSISVLTATLLRHSWYLIISRKLWIILICVSCALFFSPSLADSIVLLDMKGGKILLTVFAWFIRPLLFPFSIILPLQHNTGFPVLDIQFFREHATTAITEYIIMVLKLLVLHLFICPFFLGIVDFPIMHSYYFKYFKYIDKGSFYSLFNLVLVASVEYNVPQRSADTKSSIFSWKVMSIMIFLQPMEPSAFVSGRIYKMKGIVWYIVYHVTH